MNLDLKYLLLPLPPNLGLGGTCVGSRFMVIWSADAANVHMAALVEYHHNLIKLSPV